MFLKVSPKQTRPFHKKQLQNYQQVFDALDAAWRGPPCRASQTTEGSLEGAAMILCHSSCIRFGLEVDHPRRSYLCCFISLCKPQRCRLLVVHGERSEVSAPTSEHGSFDGLVKKGISRSAPTAKGIQLESRTTLAASEAESGASEQWPAA